MTGAPPLYDWRQVDYSAESSIGLFSANRPNFVTIHFADEQWGLKLSEQAEFLCLALNKRIINVEQAIDMFGLRPETTDE